MAINLDSHRLDIACSQCGKKFSVTIGEAKRQAKRACPGCGANITFDTSGFDSGLKQTNKALADLERSLGKLGKLR